MIGVLRQHEARASVAELCRKHGISSATFVRLEGEVRRDGRVRGQAAQALEAENAKLKRLYADAILDNAGLKELLAKKS
jgi:putative transposase